jgi:DNA-binding transcriptional LysR family regulator
MNVRPAKIVDAHEACAIMRKSLLPTAVGDGLSSLIQVHEPSPQLRREVWLLSHPELRDLRRVRVVVDWITGTIEVLTQRDPDRAVDDRKLRKRGK